MRKNNKKTMALAILTGCMLMIAACGKTEQQTTAEIVTNEASSSTTEVVENTKTVEPTEETTEGNRTEVEKIAEKDLVDVVIGGDVITVNDFVTKNREFHLAALPEIHILVPSDDITCTTEEGDSMHFRQYEIEVLNSEHSVFWTERLLLWGWT